ncbi:MAG: hypothetical protein FD129_13, partial [bacterium]
MGGRTVLLATTVPAGTPFTFTVRGVDNQWNTVPANIAVSMASSDGAAVVPTPNLTLAAGVTTFTFTPVTVGAHTVTASGGPASNTSNSFNVATSRLSLLAPGQTPDPGNVGALGRAGTPDLDGGTPGVQPFIAGTPFNVTVRLTDANFYPIASGSPITLRFYSSDPYAVLPVDSVLNADGEDVFAVTLPSATALGGGSSVWVVPLANGNVMSSTSSVLLVDPGTPARLLALPNGTQPNKGSPSGYTGTPVATAAGHGYPLRVFVVDSLNNPVLCSEYPAGPPLPDCSEPSVSLSVTDPYAPTVADFAVTGGSRTVSVQFYSNTVIDPVGGPWSVSISTTDGSPLSPASVNGVVVNPDVPYQFQVLVPTETSRGGATALLGKTTFSATSELAGATFTVTVNLVDRYWNRMPPGFNSTFALSSDDPNDRLAQMGNFTTVNGQALSTGAFLVTQATTTGWVIRASTASGDPYLAGESTRFNVYPSTPSNLVAMLGPQQQVDGVGVTGLPAIEIAGEFITVRLRAVDPGFNFTPTVNKTGIRLVSDDGFAQSSWTLTMNDGVAVASVPLRSAGIRVFTITDQSGTQPLLAGTVSSTFTMVASNPTRLRLLVPSETPVAGSNANGRTGAVGSVPAGSTLTATVQITDSFWNLTPGASQQIRLTSSDPYAVITPSTFTLVGSAPVDVVFRRAAMNTVRAELLIAPPPWGPSVVTDTSTVIQVTAGLPKNLLTLLPGESFDPGSPNGKAGTPTGALRAGNSFGVTVGIVDQFLNLVTGRPATVRVKAPVGFPFAVSAPTTSVDASIGYTNPPIQATLVAAATWHQLLSEDFFFSGLQDSPFTSTFTVSANDPVGLQLLLPGEKNEGGLGVYPNGGRSGVISTQTAGVPFQATVNLVDVYNNIYPFTSGPNIRVVTSDPYDRDPAVAVIPGGGTGIVNVTLVSKSTSTVLSVTPQTQAEDQVCTANIPADCRAQAPAAVSVPFRVWASSATRLMVILPGETAEEGKCDLISVCTPLSGAPGKSGTPAAFTMTMPQSGFQAKVNLIDDYYNIATNRSGANQDTNPIPAMPTVQISMPQDPQVVSPASATLNVGTWSFPVVPLTSLSTYTIVAATVSPSVVSLSSAGSAAFEVLPGPAHHLHFTNTPSSAAAGSAFSATLLAHDQFHNLLSSGPNTYTKSVQLGVGTGENFAPPQDPILNPSVATFLSSEAGVKDLPSAFILKRAGSRRIKATQTDNPFIHTDVTPYSAAPPVTIIPGNPGAVTVEPGPTSQVISVRAGSVLNPGIQGITGQLSDAFN